MPIYYPVNRTKHSSKSNFLGPQIISTLVILSYSPRLIRVGNFMISLSLVTPSNEVLATSSRPAILTYTSPLISTSLTILNSPLLITGFKKESETLLVQLMERFEFPSSARASRPRTAQIQISPAESNRIQIYSAKLILVAQFEGIRYPPLFLNLYVDRESHECVDGSCIHIA